MLLWSGTLQPINIVVWVGTRDLHDKTKQRSRDRETEVLLIALFHDRTNLGCGAAT